MSIPGETLSRLKRGSSEDANVPGTSNADGEGWQKAESHRSAKKRKRETNTYPEITHSAHARLHSFVKIGDLQNLVLYLLADGTAPQWVSIQHRSGIRKVVMLMVPGLEAGMVNGQVPLTLIQPEKADHANGEAIVDDKDDKDNKDDKDDKIDGAAVATHEEADLSPKKHQRKPSPDDYYPVKLSPDQLPEALRPLSDMFAHIWPIKTPGDDKYAKMHSPLSAMLTAPIPKAQEEKKAVGPTFQGEGKNWQNKRTPITKFLATTEELVENEYVLHPAHFSIAAAASIEAIRREENKKSTADGWIDLLASTSLAGGDVADDMIEDGSMTAGRNVIAMDCEMCITSAVGTTPPVFSLTRVSLISWDGEVIMDELVKPAEKITDYLTPYSGITAATLESVTTTLQDIQARLKDVLTPHTILVGHSLNSDLAALKLTFPFIVDTALLYPHPRGPPLKSSLRWLARRYLAREIQKGHGKTGHNSIEDARACLDLVKQKCEKGPLWGTSEAAGESIFKRLGRCRRPVRDKIGASADDEHRTGAVVDWGDPSRGFGGTASVAIGCESDQGVVAGVRRAVLGDVDGKVIPGGGCDFVWARLRELEAHRSWWRSSKQQGANILLNSHLSASNTNDDSSDVSGPEHLASVVASTVANIKAIFDCLPRCTAFIVYSGSGDPRELVEMQARQQLYKQEYKTKKWDELSVQWNDDDEQKLRAACTKARSGIGFITVK